MLALINAERAAFNLAPLQLELRLNDAAEDHSAWLLENNVFSHTGEDGSSSKDRMEASGFSFSGAWYAAENLAWQSLRGAAGLSDDVVDLHNRLMDSPAHRANILNAQVTVVGIGIETGVFDGMNVVMATQDFALTGADLQLDTGGATAGDDILYMADPGGKLRGLAGNDELFGSAQDDIILGQRGHDRISGGEANDILRGNVGRDTLYGDDGNDRLFGGWGHDRLDGGNGNDVLFGGRGHDVFVFSTGRDRLRDFAPNADGDKIDLGAAVGISDFNDLIDAHVIERADRLVILDDDGNRLILLNTSMDDLSADDFIF